MKYKTSSGFTLLELMIVTTILLIIFGAVFSSLVNAQKAFDAEQANAEANANARFAMNRVKEILESSGNNPGQIPNINDQTGGIISLYSSLGTTPYDPATGISGTKVPPTGTALTGASNCNPAVANTYCGLALDLQSDLTGNGSTADDITTLSTSIFSQNIITSEHIQLYLDTSNNEIDLVDMNSGATKTKTPIAEFIVALSFVVSIPDDTVTISVTARSNRAVAIENVYEKRFRYATLVTRVRVRNMNANVAELIDPLRSRGLLEAEI